MAAPNGNEFWRLRSKHGRDKLFATPELMWEAACEYFEWCEKTPLIEERPMVINTGDFQSEIDYAKVKKLRAFSLKGLCLYLDCNSKYFNDFEDGLKGKSDETSVGFSHIITRIREVIDTQKFTGAAAGLLNHTIVAMEMGLKNKHETELTMPQGVNINFVKKGKE